MVQLICKRMLSLFLCMVFMCGFYTETLAQNHTEFLPKPPSLQTAHLEEITCLGRVPMCITGYVWSDDNHDDERGPHEDGMPWVEVDLFSFTGLPIGQTFTDSQGFFAFYCLQANLYSLDLPDYWLSGSRVSDPTIQWHTIESIYCRKILGREVLLPIRPEYRRQCLSSTRSSDLYQDSRSDSQCVQHLLFLPMIVH